MQWGDATDSPTHTVNRLVSAISGRPNLVASNNQHADATAATTNDTLALIDLLSVSQKTLGKHWQRLNPTEQKEFMALFGQLLAHIAFPQSAAFFRELQVTVTDERIRGHQATVATYVEHEAEGRIDINYRLIWKDGSWLIHDVQLDGASLSRNLRGQFQQIIRHDSYAGLLRRMREKLAQATARSAS